VTSTNGQGTFGRRSRVPARGHVRARIVGTRTTSLPFALKAPPDRFVNPFGGPVGRS